MNDSKRQRPTCASGGRTIENALVRSAAQGVLRTTKRTEIGGCNLRRNTKLARRLKILTATVRVLTRLRVGIMRNGLQPIRRTLHERSQRMSDGLRKTLRRRKQPDMPRQRNGEKPTLNTIAIAVAPNVSRYWHSSVANAVCAGLQANRPFTWITSMVAGIGSVRAAAEQFVSNIVSSRAIPKRPVPSINCCVPTAIL